MLCHGKQQLLLHQCREKKLSHLPKVKRGTMWRIKINIQSKAMQRQMSRYFREFIFFLVVLSSLFKQCLDVLIKAWRSI